MMYLVIASEIKNGLRKIEDVPKEIRVTVEKALRDFGKSMARR